MTIKNNDKGVEMSQSVKELEILKEPMAIGEVFAASGMFPDVKTQAQAVVKILAGRELGLSPFQAMRSLYLVNGKLAMMADVMASMLKKNDKYDYIVEKLDDAECTIVFYQINGDKKEIGKSTFTFKDAAKAGLVNKEVWKSYPRNMLFSRALSNGIRWFCPDVSCGYTVEEAEDITIKKDIKTITLNPGGVIDVND